jgi:hypothetical protein
MNSSLRIEIQEFVRASETLAGSVHQNNGALTNEECDMVAACIRSLEKSVLPSHVDSPPFAAPVGGGALPPGID